MISQHDAEVRRLQSKIFAAMTNDDGSGPNEACAFEALIRVFAFTISMLPPEHRQYAGEYLKSCVPFMLAEANAFAEFSKQTNTKQTN